VTELGRTAFERVVRELARFAAAPRVEHTVRRHRHRVVSASPERSNESRVRCRARTERKQGQQQQAGSAPSRRNVVNLLSAQHEPWPAHVARGAVAELAHVARTESVHVTALSQHQRVALTAGDLLHGLFIRTQNSENKRSQQHNRRAAGSNLLDVNDARRVHDVGELLRVQTLAETPHI
jgi:hypothetical protein